MDSNNSALAPTSPGDTFDDKDQETQHSAEEHSLKGHDDNNSYIYTNNKNDE